MATDKSKRERFTEGVMIRVGPTTRDHLDALSDLYQVSIGTLTRWALSDWLSQQPTAEEAFRSTRLR